MTESKIKGVCGMCRGKCDVIGTIKDGRLIRVEADTDSQRGRVCPRGALSPQMIYSDRRLLHPLLRCGEKGGGEFRQVSWDEALDYIAEKFNRIIERHGARALASYFGQSVLEDSVNKLNRTGKPFLSYLGSPNDMTCSSICNLSSNLMGPVTTSGIPYEAMTPDLANCDAVFVWGKNPYTDQGPLDILNGILAARRRGAKLVVIDPRGQGLAADADLWLPVRPGTDGALALAMLKLMIEADRYDHDFVRDYTVGFEDLCAYLAELSLERLAATCGLSLEQIRAALEIFCSSEKIPLVSYTGIEYQRSGVQNNRAIHVLWALNGKLDVPGGMLLAHHIGVRRLKDIDSENPPVGSAEFPFFTRFTGQGQFSCFPQAVLNGDPYPVRGLILCGASNLVNYPDTELWRETYKKLDCLVVLDRYLSEDARYADVVLPVTTMWENQSVISIPGGWKLRRRFIEPLGEAKNDVFVFQAIAERLGFGEAIPADDESLGLWILNGKQELWQQVKTAEYGVVKPRTPEYRKYASGELRKDGQPGFPTPSGKFEISSTLLRECGFEPLPKYTDFSDLPAESADGLDFVLTTGARSKVRMNSFGLQFPAVQKMEPYPAVEIAPADAERLQIAAGDAVRVSTVHGSRVFTARICGMSPGCVHIPHGGGAHFQPEAWRKGNINEILSMDNHDPISGFVLLKSQPCRLEKCPTVTG